MLAAKEISLMVFPTCSGDATLARVRDASVCVCVCTQVNASVCARACLHGRGERGGVGDGKGFRLPRSPYASTRLRAFTRTVKATVPRTRLARARHIDLPFPGPLKPTTHARV